MPNPWDANPNAFLAQMMGGPSNSQETRNSLLRFISSMAGGPSSRATLEQLQANPTFEAFTRRALEAGFDPVELVNARNQNIGDYESGGVASRVGDFMDRSGLGDLITYGTIGAAGAGAAGGLGVGPFSGGSVSGTGGGSAAGSFGGSAGGNAALSTVSLPAGVGPMAVPGGAGVVLPSVGTSTGALAAGGMATMPSIGGGGVLSKVSNFLGGNGGLWGQIGGSLISGILGTRAAGRAADAQTGANQAAIGEQRRQFDTIMGLTQPGRDVGNQSMNAIARLLGLPGIEGMEGGDTNALTNLPGTDTIVNDAMRRIRQSGAARGSAGGNVLAELGDRISGFQNDRMTNALFRLAGFGPGATNTAAGAAGATGANVGNLMQSSGLANASGILGAGHSQNNALQPILQMLTMRGMLNAS